MTIKTTNSIIVILALAGAFLFSACAGQQEGGPTILTAPLSASEGEIITLVADEGCDYENDCDVFLGKNRLARQGYQQSTSPVYKQPPTQLTKPQSQGEPQPQYDWLDTDEVGFQITALVPLGLVATCELENKTQTGGCTMQLYVEDEDGHKSRKRELIVFEKGSAAGISLYIPDDTGEPCLNNNNCPAGQICMNGHCYSQVTPPPSTTGDCDPSCGFNQICENGNCVTQSEHLPPGDSCTTKTDCGAYEKCTNGICKSVFTQSPCTSDAACGNLQICDNGQCQISCDFTSECPTGKTCIHLVGDQGTYGLCLTEIEDLDPGPQQNVCQKAADCENNQVCDDGTCRPLVVCEGNGDCLQGQTCKTGVNPQIGVCFFGNPML